MANNMTKTDIDVQSYPGVLYGTIEGVLDLAQMKASTKEMWSEAEGSEKMVFWDLCNTALELCAEDVRHFARFTKENSPLSGFSMAILVQSDLHFGMLRMFEVFRGSDGTSVAVFRDREKAFEWLGVRGVPKRD